MNKKVIFRTTITIIKPEENIKTVNLNNSLKKKSNIIKIKKKRCPNGTRRNKKSKQCISIKKRKRCPNGTRRNKKTNQCYQK
jgi:hypothetical protein